MHQLLEGFRKLAPKRAIVFCVGFLALPIGAIAQVPTEKPLAKPAEKSTEKAEEPPNAAQIELLETKYRFESNGDWRKEVHALVKINSELGVRQFARLNFDYNRSFQSVEIPMARITHANGGTSDVLPSAITDFPNPAVEKFPAYHDVRVKSVRILGLQPGDSLEYRVITTTTKPPLAPDFWLGHSFDRTGVVQTEDFILNLPASVAVQINPQTPANSVEKNGAGDEERANYHWRRKLSTEAASPAEPDESKPDIFFTTLDDIGKLADRLAKQLYPRENIDEATQAKAEEFFTQGRDPEARLRAIYTFVSQKIVTVDVPLGTSGFRTRKSGDIMSSGYGTPEDKAALFAALARDVNVEPYLYFTLPSSFTVSQLLPSQFEHLLVGAILSRKITAFDPSLEVAPFGVISAKLRGKTALCATETARPHGVVVELLPKIPGELPFLASQRVHTTSKIASNGTLSTKVNYELRGDNELLLRVAFHKTPTEKQKEIAQFLALSDGFRGKVTSVKTSDPYDTEKPFEVEYELTQEKFVDWSKKPVRVPALLPLPGLPDTTKKPAVNSQIDLGTPLDITLTGTLRLPPGTVATAPTGTSVKRDYATFTSTYSSKANVINFTRHLNFLLPEIPTERSIDLSAFLHAVQSDQSQLFVLDKPESVPPAKPK
jgi:hypothetical protein